MVSRHTLISMVMCIVIPHVKCSSRQDLQMLHDQLFQGYNENLGPRFNQDEPISIHIAFNLYSINDFDDKSEKLSITGYFLLTWTDDRMSWDPLQHGNITSVLMKASRVWVPPLFIGKPYNKVAKIGNDFIQINYNNSGTASWIVPDLYAISCPANTAYYPIDKQFCEIIVAAWGYKKGDIAFVLPSHTVTTYDFSENGMWNVLSTQIRTAENPLGDYVVMTIEFQRRPLFVILVFLLPISFIGILNPLVFLLSPDPGERSGYGVTLMLSMAVFLTAVSDKLPSTSEPHLARVCIYLLMDLMLSLMIMIFTIFGLKLHNHQDTPIPCWIKKFVLTSLKHQRDSYQHSLTEENRNQPKTPKWRKNIVQAINEETLVNEKDGRHKGRTTVQETTRDENRHNDITENYDNCKQCSWSDVGKVFDKYCLVLFICLQTCRFAVTTIDTMIYLYTSSDL
ncbi:neuronal acetylcholine receptor subunit beta-3-like [Ylistrum balloti]|uniref:neuronal acetylcholine receptor subunit beta-3-like n=1 Tax=Ylistrum balloti TaxID=509963 RepID=UPI002905F607|nr:neuronal acetylcholine receptor subunit beta-3-like [Ylistrum balloti]